jgi:putative acetyltransferase
VTGDGLTITAEPFDSPTATALLSDLMADLEARYAADGPGDGDDPEIAGAWAVRAEQVVAPNGAFVVAWLGGEAVGCGALRRILVDLPDVGEIKRMYVAPQARRRGVSRALLVHLEATAAALGYRRLQLETGFRQPEAVRLYETAGYHRIPPYGQYKGDELSICFAKDLVADRS